MPADEDRLPVMNALPARCPVRAIARPQPRRGRGTDAVAIILLAVATLVIGWLFARTLLGIAHGELRALSN
jgi:hypothetical protein